MDFLTIFLKWRVTGHYETAFLPPARLFGRNSANRGVTEGKVEVKKRKTKEDSPKGETWRTGTSADEFSETFWRIQLRWKQPCLDCRAKDDTTRFAGAKEKSSSKAADGGRKRNHWQSNEWHSERCPLRICTDSARVVRTREIEDRKRASINQVWRWTSEYWETLLWDSIEGQMNQSVPWVA